MEKSRIHIILSTYNREKDLAITLEAFGRLDISLIELLVIVVDNHSTDSTKQVVEKYANRLPLKYLYEPKPGKNCALNLALKTISPAPITIFTDDDVTPDPSWLNKVVEASVRHPDYAIFGGCIVPKFPEGIVPKWARLEWIQRLAFSMHDHGHGDMPYTGRNFPFGPNFWVRAEVLKGRSYDERVGPRPTNRIMGSETSFLLQCQRDGFQMIYCGASRVEHRIQPEECTVKGVCWRAFRYGRYVARSSPFPRARLRRRALWLWKAVESLKCLGIAHRFVRAWMTRDADQKAERLIYAWRNFGEWRERLVIEDHDQV